MQLSPQFYGLNARTKLQEVAPQHLAIVKLIKSRIIRKDALKVLVSVEQIKTISPEIKVSLICHDNICSKSVKLLEEDKVGLIFVP